MWPQMYNNIESSDLTATPSKYKIQRKYVGHIKQLRKDLRNLHDSYLGHSGANGSSSVPDWVEVTHDKQRLSKELFTTVHKLMDVNHTVKHKLIVARCLDLNVIPILSDTRFRPILDYCEFTSMYEVNFVLNSLVHALNQIDIRGLNFSLSVPLEDRQFDLTPHPSIVCLYDVPSINNSVTPKVSHVAYLSNGTHHLITREGYTELGRIKNLPRVRAYDKANVMFLRNVAMSTKTILNKVKTPYVVNDLYFDTNVYYVYVFKYTFPVVVYEV
jgi:hypothetical protein